MGFITKGGDVGPIILALCMLAAPPDADGIPERAQHTEAADTVPAARVSALPVAASWVVEGATTGSEHGALHLVSAALEPEAGPFAARVELLGKWGHDEAVSFPSSQGLSSLDAYDFRGVGEAWLEWRAAGARVKAGWVDANTEFATSAVAAAFANPSFGLTPTLAFMPSYPAPRPSVNAFVAPFGAELGVGAYRADGDWSAVVQATGAVPYASSLRWQAGVATCGHIVEHEGHGEASTYLIVDWHPTATAAGFVKVARAGSMRHVAAGLTSTLPAPFDLSAGLGASMVSEPPGDELVAELFVAARVTEWLVVQPDLQVRMAPGAAPAAAGLLRVVVAH
jgi:hypothetical protein